MRRRRPVVPLSVNQQEAAAALGVSVDHFVRHVRPKLPFVLSGAHRLYRVSALERYLAEHEAGPAIRA